MWTDRRTDGHINLIGGLVTRNPPKNYVVFNTFCVYDRKESFQHSFILCMNGTVKRELKVGLLPSPAQSLIHIVKKR